MNNQHYQKLKDKFKESLIAVLPIIIIVLLLSFIFIPISLSVLLCFLIGAVMLITGMTFFTLGAEISMTPIGEKIGSSITKTRSISFIVIVAFLLGFFITIAEPDLQVLAEQVPAVPNMLLIISVAIGVGIFLVIGLLRMLFSIPLNYILIFFYAIVFITSIFVPESFLAVSFDSGGVTTGPITVPFIIALGIGVSAIRSDRHAADDSFGLVSLASVGPILSVMILSLFYKVESQEFIPEKVPNIENSIKLFDYYIESLPHYIREISISLLPIILFFLIFQLLVLKLDKHNLIKIIIGLFYTYIGLILFLTGVNVGFMFAGNYLGQMFALVENKWILVIVAMVMGYFVVKAEPAVYVLNKQVEEVTDGAISAKTMGTFLSVGISISLGVAMIRVITQISIMWFLIPGYLIAIIISFFVPKIYTAIAFDSGGVASGPMTAAFLLPFTQGVCYAMGGNVVEDAFGIVALVAMTPLITIQVLGLISKLKEKKSEPADEIIPSVFDTFDDDAIIEL